MTKSVRVALIGSGVIAHTHAEALKNLPGLELAAVVDVNGAAAKSFAAKWGIPNSFDNVEDAIKSGSFDRAHILVPPDFHAEVTSRFVEAGIPTLVEKPVTVSSAENKKLRALAKKHDCAVGVNQNFVFHTAFRKLRETLESGAVGKLRMVQCLYSVPLRQLAGRQFGHWMFHQPGNILLEQAVHPLSQIRHLTGEIEDLQVTSGSLTEISPDVPFCKDFQFILKGTEVPATMNFAVGQNYPFWQITAVCDDGVLVADILSDRFHVIGRSRWMEFMDQFLVGGCTATQIGWSATKNAATYILALLKLKPRSDPFYISMKESIRSFHGAVKAGQTPMLDLEFGAELVDLCEKAATKVFGKPKKVEPQLAGPEKWDVTVLGGSGFIGAHVVRQLVEAGKTVGVMARNVRNLAPIFYSDSVTLIRGDVKRKEDVLRAIGESKQVVNLAHGGGGDSWEAIREAMVGSARIVADCCLEKKVGRLIHIGSIAGLYLGDENEVINGRTKTDPRAEIRADYSRAKAEADEMLFDYAENKGLPVVILRPGVVIGEGTSAFHSGLGVYNTEQHCLGWNKGHNPLPFILVEDVASAIVASLSAKEVDGKAYNLVGDVLMNAREYIDEVGTAMNRPLKFHPQAVWSLWAEELFKWMVKRVIGRSVPVPAYRDIKSRGMNARFDCSDAKKDLGWQPVSDRRLFLERGIPAGE